MATVVQLKKAIDVMQRAICKDSIDMNFFQDGGFPVQTEKEFYKNKIRGDFCGHIAVSPEFHGDGGKIGMWGQPCAWGQSGVYAIKRWLNITMIEADNLVFGGKDKMYFGKEYSNVTAEDIVVKLKEILSCYSFGEIFNVPSSTYPVCINDTTLGDLTILFDE